ncbi:biotin--[acetyl-CoA-carboxylase] ligase [Mailhella sp.]|uniref:biotin--[acetyl-CoA-carboxylase] ligase n=1 Tax=Mailhella sp. TaxID=1981029 RepID=UPI00406346B5
MNESAVIRLLHQGLPCERGLSPAKPFSVEELERSPLRIVPDAENASGWVAREEHGLCWLERPAPGLPAPAYITGAASSSLDAAKALLKLGLFPEWASVLSLSQSAGRGQMRRAWVSPEGNLYAALRLPNEGPFADTAAAPAIGGLLAEALENENAPVMLKWPNDLMQGEKEDFLTSLPKKNACRKVGGILLEERSGALVAGIGINTKSAPEDASLRDNYAFSAGIIRNACGAPLLQAQAGNTKDSQQFVSIFTLWKRLVERLFSCYAYTTDPAPWWPALAEKHLAFRGCRAVLAEACPENEAMERVFCEGIVDGVTPSGALRLRTEYGMDTFLGGSLLPGS